MALLVAAGQAVAIIASKELEKEVDKIESDD